MYEGGVRLPMVMRWPNGLDRRDDVDELVHFTDWLPTLAAVAGAEVTDGPVLDGVNVLPLFRGEPAEVPEVRYWQWNRYAPVATCNAAMRDGRWKLVRPAIAAMELFDIEADPSEEHDLAASEPARVERMEASLGAWFESVEADRRSIRD